MVSSNLGETTVRRDMVHMFEDKVYEGTVLAELQGSFKYCQSIAGDQGMEPLGITCPKASAKYIHALF